MPVGCRGLLLLVIMSCFALALFAVRWLLSLSCTGSGQTTRLRICLTLTLSFMIRK